MRDLPDGTLLVTMGVIRGDESVPPTPANEAGIVALARLTTSSASYGTVVSYTVPAATTFVLAAIEMAASDYSKAVFRLTIAGVQQFADKSIQTSFNPQFAAVQLSPGDVVLLEAHSDGSTSINVDGAIEGKEVT